MARGQIDVTRGWTVSRSRTMRRSTVALAWTVAISVFLVSLLVMYLLLVAAKDHPGYVDRLI